MSSSKNIYYVYQYYDPIRKEPIYIGKGFGRRAWIHLTTSKNKNNKNYKPHAKFYNRINWIREQGKEPNVTILKENLFETKALKLEGQLERKIGRKNIGKGPLLNLRPCGSKGSTGFKYTNEQIKLHSGENNHMWGKHHSLEHKLKISKLMRGRNNPNFGKQPCAAYWEIVFPNGNVKKIKNLSGFCRKFKLSCGSMIGVSKGRRKHYKKYKCKKL